MWKTFSVVLTGSVNLLLKNLRYGAWVSAHTLYLYNSRKTSCWHIHSVILHFHEFTNIAGVNALYRLTTIHSLYKTTSALRGKKSEVQM